MHASHPTPTGGPGSTAGATQAGERAVAWRRRGFALGLAAAGAGLVALFAATLAPGGFDGVDIALLLAFVLYLPWPLLGLGNALVGLALMRLSADPVAAVCPPARHGADTATPLTARTAILLCIRNEDPARVFGNARQMLADLASLPEGGRFELHILSDTDDPALAAAEEAGAAALAAASPLALRYRRRRDNAGFKAGNIRAHCATLAGIDFILVLDADSLMTGARMVRMARVMEATPRLGILQSLAVGRPSASPLARLFQFGMRLGMRSYTLGSAWWQADCGPYWGHNALLRLAPFLAHCDLPEIAGRGPLAGPILSHDQIEAVLMRRAGYEVRVEPDETGSFEENPTELIEHMRRDARWCRGNLQYLALLGLPGLRAVSRLQLVLAVLMFLGSPLYLALWTLLLVQALRHDGAAGWLASGPALVLLGCGFLVLFAPKIAAALDVLARPAERARFGGAGRFLAGCAAETVFALLFTPIAAFGNTVTLGRMLAGRRAGWGGQARDSHTVGWREALRRFWPETLTGAAAALALAALDPLAPLLAAPAYAGLLLAVPLTVVTARPDLGAFLQRRLWCAIPEEIAARAAPTAEPPAATGDPLRQAA
ncbi:glucans biosynthesis glucosyltransferase MdoH [Ancylobacter lacus]|uniref:glucans biosynthesis glucosyltransferase MdoH n=1 Tax=Ancylobacter lacus TaxID=2579970 RepID=UPI001BCC225F|nr:glucans biosynthesis glucosyltransferase MdoH [Ancylobacter lacus]MBS7539187.1 glucans biosynthesis glucosyltransferase MdoH [Ancylobacter lacus]